MAPFVIELPMKLVRGTPYLIPGSNPGGQIYILHCVSRLWDTAQSLRY